MGEPSLLDLASRFGDIGRRLSGHGDCESALATLTELAVREVPGAEFAGITLGSQGGFRTMAPTDEIVRRTDDIQYELNSGPCVDSALEDTTYRADDLLLDERWPEFGKRTVEATGIRSMLSFRLYLEHDEALVGALNLYALEPGAFDEESVTVGLLLATHGALAVTGATARQKAANLMTALSTSRDIGVAMGVIMSQFKVDREQAFDLLRIASQHTHRKLADLAVEVAERGALPPMPQQRARPRQTGT